jgi:hypothetical protein
MHDLNAQHEGPGSTSSEDGAKIVPFPGLQSDDVPRQEEPAQPAGGRLDERPRHPQPVTVKIAAGIGCLLGATLVIGVMALKGIWPDQPVPRHTTPPLSSQPITLRSPDRPQPSPAPPRRHSRSQTARRRHHVVPPVETSPVAQSPGPRARPHHDKHPATHHSPPAVPQADANVIIQAADGGSSLGRNVIATGNVGAAPYTCFAVGWYVINAEQWSGYFIKTLVRAGQGGSFATGTLQMGSPGETTSSWWPFLLGGTPSGCAWLAQLWDQTAIGEYHGAWPPPGLTLLYQAPAPIHRAS